MKKRGILYFLLGFSVFALIAVYLLLGFYYNGTFSYGTWINNVYCTGKTVDEANNEIINKSYYSGIIITSADGQKFFVDARDIDFDIDYHEELKNIMDSQNPFLWGLNLLTSRNRSIVGNPTFDEDALKELLSTWEVFNDKKSYTYALRKNEEGYYLEKNEQKIPNFDKFFQRTKLAISYKEYELDLSKDDDLYDERKLTKDDEALLALYEKIESVQNIEASFKIGESKLAPGTKDFANWMVTIEELNAALEEKASTENPGDGLFLAGDKVIKFPADYKVEKSFITDKDGNILLSCSKIFDFVSNSFAKLNTNSCIDRFQKNGKGTIYISANKNGKLIDEKKEYNSFLNSIEGKGPSETEVVLPKKTLIVDASELGDEYILVDMGKQELKYFRNGKLYIHYDIVSGNTALGRGTPVGFYHIYNKRYHTILRGDDYATYVNYWLGVYKGIGIHDATWRKDFGGEIYKHNGSHGCINSPLDLMERLYENVDVGVPVLLYY